MKPLKSGKKPAPFSKEAIALGLDEWIHSGREQCDIPITDMCTFDETLPSIYQPLSRTLPHSEAAEAAVRYYLSGKWRLTKVVYTADPLFLDILSKSESTALYTAILRRLPFRTFYLHCPRARSLGLLVHVEPYENGDCLFAVGVIYKEQEALSCSLISLTFQDGETIQQAMDHLVLQIQAGGDPFHSVMTAPETNRRRMQALYAQSVTEALFFSYYLASQNADIRPVRSSKEHRCLRSNGTPLRIREWEIGFRTGCTITQMYRSRSAGQPPAEPGPAGIKRPHIRRAHWHHYWTGKGRSILVVKWIFPTIVHGDPDNLIPISHAADIQTSI